MIVGGAVWNTVVFHGTTPSPNDCWLSNNGLKTLELRMQRHSANALELAEFLEKQDAIARVFYPGLASSPDHDLARRQMHNGFSGLVSFEVEGGAENALSLMKHLRLPIIASSFGTTDSLIQHPGTMSHSYMTEEQKQASGITPGLIRMSVGIEAIDDLMEDFERALKIMRDLWPSQDLSRGIRHG